MSKKFSVTVIIGLLLAYATAVPVDDLQGIDEDVCPRIISRSEWRARKASSSEPLTYSPVPYVVMHHGGITKYCDDQKTCSEIVRSYQNLHMDENHWFDIGYQFVIGEDGNVYEGRGWNLVGAHAPGYNTQSIGVCIIGDFTNFLPNEATLKALRSLINCGVALGKIREEYRVIGHRQTRATACPGDSLYEYVKRLPNWTDRPVPITGNQTTSSTPSTHQQQ